MKLFSVVSTIVGLTAASSASFVAIEGAADEPFKTGKRGLLPEIIEGTLYLEEVDYEDHSGETFFSIELPDGTSFRTDLPENWARDNKAVPSQTKVRASGSLLPNGRIKNVKAMVMPDDQGRNLAERKLTAYSTGTRTVLAVRIIDNSRNVGETEPSYTEAQLANSVFGSLVGGSDPVNLSSQYKDCSHNQLNFVPVDNRVGAGSVGDIVNGVTTVTVNTGCNTNSCDGTLHNAATTAINNAFGQSPSQIANHVMYCLPPNSMGGIAYANLPGWRSVYKDNWCRYVSGQMHELGHNIRFHHSNEASTYQDQSGMMGYSYSQLDGPIMCFNAAKSWESNWYENNKETFTVGSDTSKEVMLKGIATSGFSVASTSDKALLKLSNTASTTDYYINFNHRTGFNSGTVEGANQVMITTAGNEGGGGAQSTLLAKLNQGGIWTQDINGFSITVTVISIDTTAGNAIICVTQTGFSCSGCVSDAACDDGNPCTTNTCDAGSCVTTNNNLGNCNDGLYCNGSETCVDGTCQSGPDITCDDGIACTTDACNPLTNSCNYTPSDSACSDSFCLPEFCNSSSGCQAGTPPTCVHGCNEAARACNECTVNADCDDNDACNGSETCSGGICQSGIIVNCNNGIFCDGTETCNDLGGGAYECISLGNPCTGCDLCNEDTDQCDIGAKPDCCGNGVCEVGESCNGNGPGVIVSCPQDCISGSLPGAQCNNGICETADGENCYNCPQDCNGVTDGKPSNRYCCGDNTPCSDPKCTFCTTEPAEQGNYCCGDSTCDSPFETFSNCYDCPTPTPTLQPITPPPVVTSAPVGNCNSDKLACQACGGSWSNKFKTCNVGGV
jgi:hypothetical protein